MTKLITRAALATAFVLPLVGCPGVLPGTTTPAPGQQKAGITGNVVKGTAPFENATVRLIEKVNNVSQDREVKKTDKLGNFTFENVPPGSYRVAFDRATPEQRKANETVYYAAGTDTFGFYTTTEFTFDGFTGATKQIPQMDVAWSANLNPAPDGAVSAPVTFSWNKAPKATGYSVRIANTSNNTVFSKSGLGEGETSFTWDGKDASGKTVAAGQYLWSVNLADGSGGTNVSKFTLR